MTTPRTQARRICSAIQSDANTLGATGFVAPKSFNFVEERANDLEDVVLMTRTGCDNLVRSPKNLEA